MSIEHLFYAQIASILAYVTAAFVLYRLLIAQKDAVIQLLKERNDGLLARISELESQSPDILASALAKRVEIAKGVIEELSKDGAAHKDEIAQKKEELEEISQRLSDLTNLVKESDLVCPKCQAPLIRRDYHTAYGHVDGREMEADLEFVEYACGYSTSDDPRQPIRECGASRAEA